MSSRFADLLKESSGGSISAFSKNTPVGTSVSGPVVSVAVRQATDPVSGKPSTWDDGNPKEQVLVTLQTNLRDPSVEDDDGARTVYIKWWGVQRQALIQALRNANADDIETGGHFSATYTGDGPQPDNRSLSPAKLYTFVYRAPSAAAGLIQSAAAGAATAAQQAPQYPPVTNPVTSGFTVPPEQFTQQAPAPAAAPADMLAKMARVRELAATNLVPVGVIASMTGLDTATVAAIIAAPAA
jgi:hypothetical protein